MWGFCDVQKDPLGGEMKRLVLAIAFVLVLFVFSACGKHEEVSSFKETGNQSVVSNLEMSNGLRVGLDSSSAMKSKLVQGVSLEFIPQENISGPAAKAKLLGGGAFYVHGVDKSVPLLLQIPSGMMPKDKRRVPYFAKWDEEKRLWRPIAIRNTRSTKGRSGEEGATKSDQEHFEANVDSEGPWAMLDSEFRVLSTNVVFDDYNDI